MPPKSFDTQEGDLPLFNGNDNIKQEPEQEVSTRSDIKEEDESTRLPLDTKTLFAQSVVSLEEEKQDASSPAQVSILISSIQERLKIMDKLLDESDKWKNDSEEEKNGVTTEIREQLVWAMEEWEELDALDQKNVTQIDSLYDQLQNMKEAQSSGYTRDNKGQTNPQQKQAVSKLRPSQSRRIHNQVPCEIDRFGNILPSSRSNLAAQLPKVSVPSSAPSPSKTSPSKPSNGFSFTKKFIRFFGI